MKTGIIIGAILAVVSVPIIIRCQREKKGQKSRFHKGVQTSKVETLDYKYVLRWIKDNHANVSPESELISIRGASAINFAEEVLDITIGQNTIIYVLQTNDEVIDHLIVEYQTLADSYADMLGQSEKIIQKIK